jgi:hypothetical protein
MSEKSEWYVLFSTWLIDRSKSDRSDPESRSECRRLQAISADYSIMGKEFVLLSG